MERQVDLRIEGDNLRTFRYSFGCSDDDDDDDSGPMITFPRPEPGWISERVLVEDHKGEDAIPISRLLDDDDSAEGLEVRSRRLARPLLGTFLKMVFVDNFVHGDLQPGNVLMRAAVAPVVEGGNLKQQRQRAATDYTIIFLDAGIVVSLEPNDRRNLQDLSKAVVLNDGYLRGRISHGRARTVRKVHVRTRGEGGRVRVGGQEDSVTILRYSKARYDIKFLRISYPLYRPAKTFCV